MNSRRLLLVQWIVMANVLSHAYKGILLSTLLEIRELLSKIIDLRLRSKISDLRLRSKMSKINDAQDRNLSIPCQSLRYNDPIDTVEQMRESGLPFYIMDHTVMVWLAATDPRDVVKSINSEQGGNWLCFRGQFC